MSNRYKGGIISATPPTTTGGETGVASGAWTLEQQLQAQAAGNWPIQPPPLYIENVFSTWVYSGNSGSNPISNGINLSGKGGLVWIKSRSNASTDNILQDTSRGANKVLYSNSDVAQSTFDPSWFSFGSSGFTLNNPAAGMNASGYTYVSWTFREQPKFFDIVTYEGNNTNRTISHNLGSTPGCIIIKCASAAGPWPVYHRGLTSATTSYLNLNETSSRNVAATYWNSTAPTSTVFSLGTANDVNQSGQTYIAYLFAHNAGGFGPTETDNVITCGSFTSDGSGNVSVDLGWEPQWILTKRTNAANNWQLFDNMRGMTTGGGANPLAPNTSDAEANLSAFPGVMAINATGFSGTSNGFAASSTFVYIAIRRGPMATPTTGTSVFSPNTQTGANNSAGQIITTNFPVDLEISMGRNVAYGNTFIDRLRGGQNYLLSQNTDAEVNFTSWTPLIGFANNTGITDANYGSTSASYVAWNMRRAPGFFDEVCYTGTGSATTFAHNLGVVPELMIVKRRNGVWDWMVYTATDGAEYYYWMNATNARRGPWTGWNNTTPTSSVFSLGAEDAVNASGSTYVNYLFATCPGVSKVGSYTGTGATQTINCGFTGGARFVLIKRTDSTGNWYVWDTARGMVSGTDPYLLLNSATPESNINLVFTAATGFQIVSSASDINANGGTFIFLAIA